MKNRIIGYLESLRFPFLLIVTSLLFLVNVFIPDVIPFVDEVLLALLAVILSRLKRKPKPDQETSNPEDETEPENTG